MESVASQQLELTVLANGPYYSLSNRLRHEYRYLSQLNIVAGSTQIFRLVSFASRICPFFILFFDNLELKNIYFLVHKTVTDDCNYSGCTLHTGVLRVDHLSLL
jgi:hypothetical protein